jgi:hypothetical protein
MTQKEKRQFGPWSWTEGEIKLLKEIYPLGNTQKVAERLGRPLTTVRQKAYDLGLKTNSYTFWTAEQIQLLKELYPKSTAQALCKKLKHSAGSIRIKASQLKLKKAKNT